jgi:hypothetical protein
MKIKDYSKVHKGYRAFNEAKDASRRGDFEEAGLKYLKEARYFREGYATPGKNVFWAECKALQVFEELVKKGRHDLRETYAKVAKHFFQDWNTGSIKSRLRHRDVRKALIERNVRLSESEFIHADDWLKRSESRENLSVIAGCYKRAAEALQGLEDIDKRRYMEHAPNMNWYRSCCLKFEAFEHLQDKKMQILGAEEALREAEERFEKAIKHAEKSVSYSREVFSEFHPIYLRYWREVVRERLHILCFMTHGKKEDYELSFKSWREGLKRAEELAKLASEDSIFPNRFYSLEDLKLESEFLKAASNFRHLDWESCTHHLEDWCKSFPIEYYLTWRHIQVYIRFLVAKALQAFEKRERGELVDICGKLTAIRNSEPIGKTGKFLCDEVRRLPILLKEGRKLDEKELSLFWNAFPLDSHTDEYQTEEELGKLNPFLSFPQMIYNWIEQSSKLRSDIEVDELKSKFLGSIEAFLGYLHDYYSREFSADEIPDLDEIVAKHNIETLIQALVQLINSKRKEKEKFLSALTGLAEAIRQASRTKDVRSYLDAHKKACDTLLSIARFSPVIVNIGSTRPSTQLLMDKWPNWLIIKPEVHRKKTRRIIKAKADWSLHEYRHGRENFFIDVPIETPLKQACYYLPPDWRKGNRIFYMVTEDQPLFQSRFQPKWDFWLMVASSKMILPVTKSSLVTVYGSYKPKELKDELREVCRVLNRKGYGAFIIEDLPETREMKPEDKVRTWGSLSRFCVIIDRAAAGHLPEYLYLQGVKAIIAHLRPKGAISTFMIGRSPEARPTSPRTFEFDHSPFDILDKVIKWAEEEREELLKESEYYPWKRHQTDLLK